MEFKEWLGDNELSYTIWNNKYRVNDESLDEWFDRVSNGNPRIKKLIQERKFLFAGRTLSNRGTNRGSYSNCYSSGFVHDSLQDILRVNNNIALTYKAQGGQGLSLSLLRPKGTPIGDYYESDGIIPFMELYNKTTETISQGGCISEDQLVLTDKGLKQIKDVQIGDKAWTKLGYIPVNYKYDKGLKEVFKVTTKSGYTIETTIDHKFNIDGFHSKHLSELKVGDNIVIITGDTTNTGKFLPKYYAWGTFLANGSISKKENFGNITFSEKVPTGKTIVSDYIKSLINKSPKIKEYEKFYRVYLNKETISKLGYKRKTTKTITIPDEVLYGDNDIKLSFIAGLLDTDGTVYENSFKYSTISEKFANQLCVLLNSVGFVPSINIEHRESINDIYNIRCAIYKNSPYIPSYKVSQKVKATVVNSKRMTPFTINNLGIKVRTGHLKKINKDETIGYYTYINECLDYYTPCVFDPIDSIVPCGTKHVYDLSLEKEHYFSCNGFYVSNSRKGALLISLDIWHKEAPAFITIKSDLNKINKANLSVEIDDDFMKIIENYYSTGESPIITIKREYSGHKIEYDVNPVELYKLICNQAKQFSEPGLIFTNRFRNYNLMEFCDDYQIETCNP